MTDFYIAKSDGSSPGGVTGSDSNDGLTPSTPKATLDAIIQISGDADTDGDNIFFYGGTYTDSDLNSTNNSNQVASISDANKRQHSLIAYLDQEVIFRRGGASSTFAFIRFFNLSLAPQDNFKISGIKFIDSDTDIGAGKLTNAVLAFYEGEVSASATPTVTIENCTFEFSDTTFGRGIILIDDQTSKDGNEIPYVINNCTFTLTGSDPDIAVIKSTVMFGSTSSVTFTNNTVTVTHTGSGDAGDPLLDFGTLGSSSDVTVAVDTGGSVTVANNTFDITSGTDSATWEVIKCTGTKDINITSNSFDVKQSETSAGEMKVIQVDADPGTAKTHTIEISGNNFKIDEKRGYGVYIRADNDYSELNGNYRVTNNKVIGVDDFNTLSASGTGIYVQEVNSPTISQNVLRNHYDGILVNGCATPVITDNILEDVGDDGDDAFAAVGLFVTNSSGGTIKRNKFIQSFNSNRTNGTSIRIDTQPGFTLSDNIIILKKLNSANSYRYFRCNDASGVNNSQFGGSATASTFSGNVYVNTANNPNTGSSIARAGSDSNVPIADYKAHVDPTAKYDPAMLTQNLSKGLSKPFLTEEVINIREF